MATCPDCKLDMSAEATTSCTTETVTLGDKTFPRHRYGSELPEFTGTRCHDCNAARGGLHHLGCDVERCPQCGGQLISCDCWPTQEDEGGEGG